jgi:hypothetical protein
MVIGTWKVCIMLVAFVTVIRKNHHDCMWKSWECAMTYLCGCSWIDLYVFTLLLIFSRNCDERVNWFGCVPSVSGLYIFIYLLIHLFDLFIYYLFIFIISVIPMWWNSWWTDHDMTLLLLAQNSFSIFTYTRVFWVTFCLEQGCSTYDCWLTSCWELVCTPYVILVYL